MSTPTSHDAAFAKYAECGAYHWREVSGHWIGHHAFTAERYRRTLAAAGPLAGTKVLDYGCGDGALLGQICRQVGPAGEAHGFDPNPEAAGLVTQILAHKQLAARLYDSADELPHDYFDHVICAEVIEHVLDPQGLLARIHDILRPGGRAVITTPVRLTEFPEDGNHVQEWFPSEFQALFEGGPLTPIHYEQFIPAGATEVYFWRPRFLLRVPIFRLMCNLVSIYGRVNALSWLRMRPRLFTTQMMVLERPQ